ncbi:MAG: hypothetical protein L6Q57_02700 [Alphaproteobacteria bacterium]|nr:hypothetical protein [Alphaproteobacteria bacterium]
MFQQSTLAPAFVKARCAYERSVDPARPMDSIASLMEAQSYLAQIYQEIGRDRAVTLKAWHAIDVNNPSEAWYTAVRTYAYFYASLMKGMGEFSPLFNKNCSSEIRAALGLPILVGLYSGAKCDPSASPTLGLRSALLDLKFDLGLLNYEVDDKTWISLGISPRAIKNLEQQPTFPDLILAN